jgi:hypothetical protein
MTVNDLESGFRRLHACLAEAEREGRPDVAGSGVFEVLGMLRREPAHSAVLAWLLDPQACHGLRDSFLRAFWLRVLGDCPTHLTPAMVSRRARRARGRAEITVTGLDWRFTIDVNAAPVPKHTRGEAQPAISWRIRREALVEELAPAPHYEEIAIPAGLLNHVLPAA